MGGWEGTLGGIVGGVGIVRRNVKVIVMSSGEN
jgi:hypothetical protein